MISLGLKTSNPMNNNASVLAMFWIMAIVAVGQTATLPVCASQANNGFVVITAVVIGNASVLSPPSFSPQPVAPGELVAVNGIWVGSVSVSSTSPLPTKISGVELLINDVPAPLLAETLNSRNLPFVWQIMGQVPFNIPVGGTAVMRLRITNPDNSQCQSGYIEAPVVHAMPALASKADGSVLILNQDNSPNSGTNPLAAQDSATVYGVGFGRLAGPAKAGEVMNRAVPLAQPLEVAIDGIPATVRYAGSAPGTVGEYRVNFRVPNVGGGSHNGSLQVNGAKTSFTIFVQ
jgi:uncharacterized protein (TIGR03437 family)